MIQLFKKFKNSFQSRISSTNFQSNLNQSLKIESSLEEKLVQNNKYNVIENYNQKEITRLRKLLSEKEKEIKELKEKLMITPNLKQRPNRNRSLEIIYKNLISM